MANHVGVIFSSSEADSLFGQVSEFQQINTSNILSIMENSENYLMFKIISSQLFILGDNRVLLYPEIGSINPNETFMLYSKNRVQELLEKGENNITKVEKRDNVYSLTNGNITLEQGSWCPPFCTSESS
jgi:hypothetical protein